MARRLCTSGYYVMLPNMYYRAGVMELGPINPDPESPERKRMFELMSSLSIPLVMEDTKALLAYADGQKAANTKIVARSRLAVGFWNRQITPCVCEEYRAEIGVDDRNRTTIDLGRHLRDERVRIIHLPRCNERFELGASCGPLGER